MSTRNANHILSALRASGELEIRHNEGPRGTNRYRIVLADCEGVKPASPMKAARPLKRASAPTPEAGFTPEAGDTLKQVAQTPEAGFPKPLKPASDEPSVNHQEPPKREGARRPAPTQKHSMPDDFGISEAVRTWAASKGWRDLEAHLEAFKLKAAARGYRYSDWDAAFKSAIRDDWARLRGDSQSASAGPGRAVGQRGRQPREFRHGAGYYEEEADRDRVSI